MIKHELKGKPPRIVVATTLKPPRSPELLGREVIELCYHPEMQKDKCIINAHAPYDERVNGKIKMAYYIFEKNLNSCPPNIVVEYSLIKVD